jgi:hemerythrin
MSLQWTPRLSVGIEKVDAQHRELIARVNELLAGLGAHKGKEALAPVVAFVRSYTVEHFTDETRMMREARFPKLEAHLALHAGFVKDFDALAAAIEKDGATSHLTIKASNLLCDWLRDHIAGADKEYGAFLAASKRPAVPGY